MHQIQISSIEILEQGQKYLKSVTPHDYTRVIAPYFISSCGQHMRHIIDHFLALREAIKSQKIDYDQRHRGSVSEIDISKAQQHLADIKRWLISLPDTTLDLPMEVRSEISISSKSITLTKSTLARELLFVTSHAIHHYSIIGIIAKMQNHDLDENFGIAPATATFFRERSCAP